MGRSYQQEELVPLATAFDPDNMLDRNDGQFFKTMEWRWLFFSDDGMANGSNQYVTVRTGRTVWGIGPDIDGEEGWILSGSAGGICQVSNSYSDRTVSKAGGIILIMVLQRRGL